jgi:glucose-1-phosphate thymidylyltransferase
MNALILAAGYATRLYPLTKDFPKPLLDIGGRTILDHLVDQLERIAVVSRIVLVTNRRFAPVFRAWQQARSASKPVEILDDGTACNEDRLGAVGDLRWAIQQVPLDNDLLVTAADNLLRFPLAEFVAAFQARRATQVCVHVVEDADRRRRTGIAVLGEEDRVLEFAEKPPEPKTHWAVPPIYAFPRRTLSQVSAYLDAGGSPEAPGHFIEWLCQKERVFAYRIQGSILDIGTPQSLEAARRLFQRPEIAL